MLKARVDLDAALDLEQAAVDPAPDDDRHNELLELELAALDTTLAVESEPDPDDNRRDVLIDQGLTAIDAALAVESDPDYWRDELLKRRRTARDTALAVEPESDRPEKGRTPINAAPAIELDPDYWRDELLKQRRTAIVAAPAAQKPVTPGLSALAPAPYPVVPVPGIEASMRSPAELPAEPAVQSSAPSIGRDGMLRLTANAALAGLTGSLVGWYVSYGWLV